MCIWENLTFPCGGSSPRVFGVDLIVISISFLNLIQSVSAEVDSGHDDHVLKNVFWHSGICRIYHRPGVGLDTAIDGL